jgi:DHA3 family macrolide efflux protein-like MFS transporter
MVFGWKFIRARPALLRLQMLFSSTNFFTGVTAGVLVAFILERSHGSTDTLGLVNSLAAAGALAGALVVASIPIRRHRIITMLVCMAIAALAGRVALGFVTGAKLWGVLLFVRGAAMPGTTVVTDSIWQERVSTEDQGRVFGTRRILGQGSYPIALLCGGLLAEHVFTDARVAHVPALHSVLPGPGAGLALFMITLGALEFATAVLASLSKQIRTLAHPPAASVDATPRFLPDAVPAAVGKPPITQT